MKLTFEGEPVTVFMISPRTTDVSQYWRNIEDSIRFSDAYDATGILLFEGNDTYVSPWVAAQAAFERSETLEPLVAVNPVYMHPFSVAKLVNSFAQVYGRRTYLNMITGTALSYLAAMNDELAHDQRYERLGEFADLVFAFLTRDDPVTYEGAHYRVNKLKLDPPTPPDLLPAFFFAGASEAATATARRVGGTQMKMLPANLADGVAPDEAGVHFGIVTRAASEDAHAAAERLFPEDRRGERVQELTMSNTDSVWKARMAQAAKLEQGAQAGYWLRPFRCFQADCPYFVGSHGEVADLIASLVRGGVRHFILDVPCRDEEFAEVHRAFVEAGRRLG